MRGHPTAEVLIDLAEGRGSAEARRHVAECGACRTEIAQLETLVEHLREVPVPEPPALYWEAQRSRVRRQVEDEAVPARPRRGVWLWLPVLATAGALAVFVMPRLEWNGAAPSATPAAAFVPAWTALPDAEEDTGLAVLHGLVSTGAMQSVVECHGVAECLAAVPEEDLRRVAGAFQAALEGGGDS